MTSNGQQSDDHNNDGSEYRAYFPTSPQSDDLVHDDLLRDNDLQNVTSQQRNDHSLRRDGLPDIAQIQPPTLKRKRCPSIEPVIADTTPSPAPSSLSADIRAIQYLDNILHTLAQTRTALQQDKVVLTERWEQRQNEMDVIYQEFKDLRAQEKDVDAQEIECREEIKQMGQEVTARLEREEKALRTIGLLSHDL